jgi:P27 family predicted phage terminase small subunit
MPGPPKKPTALKLLQGNPGRKPLPKNEPLIAVSTPDPPSTLSTQARQHWWQLVGLLAESGIMTALDSDALAAYCEVYERWLDANQKLIQFGSVIKAPDGTPKHSPYLRVANDSFRQMRVLLSEFGLSPASRARIQAAPGEKEENPFARVHKK